MHAAVGLRSSLRRVRWVLLWFVLSMAAAIASPVVHPQRMELVCTGGGAVKSIVQTDDGAQETGIAAMDCPLCIAAGAPPGTPAVALPALRPSTPVSRPPARVHRVAFTAAPLPARGPPLFS